MKVLKIIAKLIGALLILLILAAGTLYLMRDRLVGKVVDTIGEHYQLELTYDDVSISIFRNFPRLSLGVKDLHISKNKGENKLAKLREIEVAVDFYSLWSSSEALKIHAFTLDEPMILYEVNKDSTTNWDFLFTEDEVVNDSADLLKLSLDKYEIKNAYLYYVDNPQESFMQITRLNHQGSGELSSVEFDLNTQSSIDTLLYKSGGLNFQSDYPIALDATIKVNTEDMTFGFKDAILRLADLSASLNGNIEVKDDVYDIDVTIDETSSDIKQLLSLIPEQYVKDYADVETGGELSINGTIKGKYIADQNFYPSIDFKASVRDGNINYQDLPDQITDIQFSSKIIKPEGDLNKTQISIQPLEFRLGNNPPFRMRLGIKNPLTGPQLNGEIKGEIDLNALMAAVPLEGVKNMNGLLSTDVLFDVFYPDIAEEKYDKIKLDGTASIKSGTVSMDGLPKVEIPTADISLSNDLLDVSNLVLNIGRSDFSGGFKFNNPLSIVADDVPIEISGKLSSTFLDLNEFMNDEVDTGSPADPDHSDSSIPAMFKRLSLSAAYSADKIIYDIYELGIVKGNLKVHNGEVHLSNLQFTYQDSPFTVNGNLRHLMDYVYEVNGEIDGDISVSGESFDLWKFMNSSPGGESESTDELLSLPERMNLRIKANVGNIGYESFDLKQLNTHFQLVDQKIKISEGTARLFNGLINLTGTFQADGKALPAYDFNYSMNDIPFQSAYNQIVTFKKLAPIAEYIKGFFGTDLHIKGVLTEDIMPDFNSLNIGGIVETANAQIMEITALNAIADKLQIKAFQHINLVDTKNFIDITDGTFAVKPFNLKLDEIDATVQGSHKITGEQLNYTIKTKIPREWLEKNSLASNVNKGLNWVEEQAKQHGLNLDAGDYLYVDILLGGTLKKPSVGLQLKDVGGKSLKQAAEEKIKQETKRVQDSLRNAAKREREKIEREARERADSIKIAAQKEAERKAREMLTGKKDSSGSALEEELKKTKDKAKDKFDDIKDKFNKWKRN